MMSRRRSLAVFLVAGAIVFVMSATACGGPGLQSFDASGISFQVSSQLTLEQYGFDGLRASIQKGPVERDFGALASADGDFFLSWVGFQEAPLQGEVFWRVRVGAELFRSIDPKYASVVVGGEMDELILGFEVHYAELELETIGGSRRTGIAAAWWCGRDTRVFSLVTLQDDPKAELIRFVESFSCG